MPFNDLISPLKNFKSQDWLYAIITILGSFSLGGAFENDASRFFSQVLTLSVALIFFGVLKNQDYTKQRGAWRKRERRRFERLRRGFNEKAGRKCK